ncbi:hypothetical protein H5T55_06900 [Candidatus Bipolaricaulota bacterium]|nr:hypothetical protein [Candidatus Bipolaricaulota bacterium]MBC7221174.1 hypothetical protein [Candidatus Bipolaricaulota bacterium]
MARKGILIGLLVAVLASTAWAFEPFFSDAAGNKLGRVWEGQQIYIAIKDPEKGACGIDQFMVDLIIFDFKTGATLETKDDYFVPGAWFRELGGIGSGLYFWVAGPGSNVKVSLQVGSRDCFIDAAITDVCFGNTHVLGTISPASIRLGPDLDGAIEVAWWNGAWEYLDEDVTNGGIDLVEFNEFPFQRRTARVDLEGEKFYSPTYDGATEVLGRFENNDTLILIARDTTDERNVDQDQIKIVDTVGELTVVPSRLDYGCGPACSNIVVTIEDKDENLNCNAIEYVPFFVIINPGSWNPEQTPGVTNFCSLMMLGGYNGEGDLFDEPIRWYNIYEPERYIDYSDAPWWNYDANMLFAVFFAAETSVDSGVFTFDFGNLEDFQRALGLDPTDRLPPGTTIAFYYIDPNDFDDMDLATVMVGNRPHSETFITDANGIPVSEVRIGAGWGGLYIRVYDADANVEACCQDKVVVHICDPHNEDDSEYYVIDEISNNSGIFFTQSGIPLLPVWDAVAGYQLVFDDWRIQAFNEDTIFVRYNSVDYEQASLNALGDGDPNDGFFPPVINYDAARNQYWDVSFAKVKVYDFQVFDGITHCMRFLDGNYQPVTSIPLSGSLYLEVCDYDQNEHPAMRELIFGGWNKDAKADDETEGKWEHTDPIWTPDATETTFSEFFADTRIGNIAGENGGVSISGINPTVKVFMFNAQSGAWERMDLRETAVGSGIFRSTTCVLVADARNPGEGNLGSKPGDTIMAFYQDPSNHSDISIISIKVAEGGAGGITPPTVALSVAFDKANYNPGETVTITVTDEQYAGASEITGAAKPLILKKADGTELKSWTQIPAVAGDPGKFRVSYVLPADVTGTIIAVYTDPLIPTRTAQAQATVAAPVLTGVSDVKPVPEVFSTSTAFTVYAQPAGAVPSKVTIEVYDLTGRKVATLTGTNTATVSWNGGTLRNGAYIYVWAVEGGNPIQTWTGKGFVYIKR